MKYTILALCLSSLLLSCQKTVDTIITPTPCPPVTPVCDVRGTYSGTAVGSTGASINESYRFGDNNFAVGALTATGPGITFGGYKNTCDSIKFSVYYNGNNNYYLFLGKLSTTSPVTLSGTFQNLTDLTNFGTFVFTKQ